jgi:hypothetical protein
MSKPGPPPQPGDMGVSLGRPEEVARRYLQQGQRNRAGGEENHLPEAGKGPGLSAPFDPFRRGPRSVEPDEEAVLPDIQWKAAAFVRCHEPDDARVSSPDL